MVCIVVISSATVGKAGPQAGNKGSQEGGQTFGEQYPNSSQDSTTNSTIHSGNLKNMVCTVSIYLPKNIFTYRKKTYLPQLIQG